MKSNSRKHTFVLAAMIAALALGSAAAFAGEGKHQRKTLEGSPATTTQTDTTKRVGPMEWLRTTILSLNPTDDQKAKIKTIAEEGRTAREQWRTAHETELKGLQEELAAARTAKDKEKLKALKDKMQTLYSSVPKMTETLDKIRTVLTPDQQTKFDAAVAAKKAEMKGKFFDGTKEMGGKKGGKSSETLSL